MKPITTIYLSLLFMHSYGQIVDSANGTTRSKPFSSQTYSNNVDGDQKNMFSYKTEKQKKLVIKDNLIFSTYNIQLSPIENEISDLEALECNALLKRDTAILKNLWARDFTLDESSSQILLNGKNPLPYYASLSRMVENFTAMDNIVFTFGYESSQRLKNDGSVEDPIKINYFHTWTRRNGVWKLTTKTHNQ